MSNKNASNSEQFSPEELIKRLKSQLNINSDSADNGETDDRNEDGALSFEDIILKIDHSANEEAVEATENFDVSPDENSKDFENAETLVKDFAMLNSEDNDENKPIDASDDSFIHIDDDDLGVIKTAEDAYSEPETKNDAGNDIDFLAFLSKGTNDTSVALNTDPSEDKSTVDDLSSENISDFLSAISSDESEDKVYVSDNSEQYEDIIEDINDASNPIAGDTVSEIVDDDLSQHVLVKPDDATDHVENDESGSEDSIEESAVIIPPVPESTDELTSNDSYVDMDTEDIADNSVETDTAVYDTAITEVPVTVSDETDYEFETSDDDTDVNTAPSSKPTPDYNMLIALGIPVSEVEKIYGVDAAAEYSKLTDGDETLPLQDEYADEYEYSSRSQNAEIRDHYKKEKLISFIKLCSAAILFIFVFLLENLPVFGVEFGGWLNQAKYPVVHIMIDLQLVLIAAAIALDEIIIGIKALIYKAPTVGSVLFAAFVINVIADILLCFSGEAIVNAKLSGAAFAFMALICTLSSFIKLNTEASNFDMISAKGVKCCAFTASEDDVKEKAAFFDKADYENVDSSKIVSFGKARFISGFFRKHNEENTTIVDKILIPAALVGIVAAAVLSYVSTGDLTLVYRSVSLASSFVFPVCVFSSAVLTYAKACKYASSMKSAIIGQATPFDYAGASIVSFDDKDAYPSYCVKLRNLKVYGKIAIIDVLRITSSIFRIVGGPLNDVLENATSELDKSTPTTITRYCDSGIEADFDGKRILIGKADFLHSYGIIPYSDVDDREYLKTGDVSIMYVAVNDELSAKFYVQYTLDVDFEVLLRDLNRAGICVSIRTSDPNIDTRLLQAKLNLSKASLKIVYREPVSGRSEPISEADCGIIGTGTPSELVHTIMLCDRTVQVLRTNNVIKAASLLVGIALLLILTLLSAGTNISSALLVLYQLFWMLPTIIVSKLFL